VEVRDRGAVGDEMANSRSARSAPAAAAQDRPAPIAPQGFVVRRNSVRGSTRSRAPIRRRGDRAGVGDQAESSDSHRSRAPVPRSAREPPPRFGVRPSPQLRGRSRGPVWLPPGVRPTGWRGDPTSRPRESRRAVRDRKDAAIEQLAAASGAPRQPGSGPWRGCRARGAGIVSAARSLN